MAFVKADEETADLINDHAAAVLKLLQSISANPGHASAAALQVHIQIAAGMGIPFDELRAATISNLDANKELLEAIRAEREEADVEITAIGDDQIQAFVDKLCGKSRD